MATFNIKYIKAAVGDFDARDAQSNRPFDLRECAGS